ncbi:MAG: hypothetical protein NVSMB1_20160 [Polyangiales bacterium]
MLLLVVRALSSLPSNSASAASSKPTRAGETLPRTEGAKHAQIAPPTVTYASDDEQEPEGSKLASLPPPAGAPSQRSIDNMPLVSSSFEEVDFPTEFETEDPTGPVALILVEAVGRTDPGRRRKHNEDAYLVLPEHSLFVIADGMGGYAAGEVASQLSIAVMREAYMANSFAGKEDHSRPRRGDELARSIEMANLSILRQAQKVEAQAGMGTTIVAARFSPNKQRVYVCHVGDSRAYRIRNREIVQLTQDHTLGAVGITGPSAAKLSRAVGIGEAVEVDLLTDAPRVGDHYMLCCDGLNKMVPDGTLRDIILKDNNLDRAATDLIDAANERGGRDNITVILIRVDDPRTARPA